MASTLFFCVVQDYDGSWSVSSFGGKNKAEEKRFALSMNKRCTLVTTDHDEAQRRAAWERQYGRK